MALGKQQQRPTNAQAVSNPGEQTAWHEQAHTHLNGSQKSAAAPVSPSMPSTAPALLLPVTAAGATSAT